MPYIYPEEVEHVRQLILAEKTEEAIQILKGFEKTDDFTLWFHGGLFYLYAFLNIPKTFEIADRLLKESKRVKNYFASFDSIRLKYECFLVMDRKLDEQWEMVELGEEYLKLAPKIPLFERKIREMELLHMKGVNLCMGNKQDLALTTFEETSAFFKENDRLFNAFYNAEMMWSEICYYIKGELDKASELGNNLLVYLSELKGPKSMPGILPIMLKANVIMNLGHIYFQKGELENAEEYYLESLKLCENIQFTSYVWAALYHLIRISLRRNSPTQAREYLNQFDEHNISKGDGQIFYQVSKALILKSSPRLHDKVEAEKILKDIYYQIERGELTLEFLFDIYISVHYCEILLNELNMTKEISVLDEIEPIISNLIKTTETQGSYLWLAEVKLLQAKLALIKMNLEEARIFLTQAQDIAEEHGLQRLAQEISEEHDRMLEQLNTWELLKTGNSPISERIKLASLDGVMKLLKGARAVEPSEMIEEEPILLIIMDNTGATYFNHPFIRNWDYSNLFSDFLSAFNTFSKEIFSNSIDRIKVKENTILIHPVDPFLACYVIKGQSYPALQKLTRFIEAIKKNSEIWDALNKAIKTSEMLELNKPPALKTVIDEIFT
ncbi:MAG: tetratricopeptide repeat protein [Promethearchaeota archaeon]|jgi:tetratricopeptide (TPR) repeat protein